MKYTCIRFIVSFFCTIMVSTSARCQVVTLLSEDFSTSSFTTNGWTFPNGQSNWTIGSSNPPTGGTSPHAYFNWAISITNYSVALLSNTINATMVNGPVTLNYLLLLNNFSNSTLEQFKIEYKTTGSSTWTLAANYTNTLVSIQNWSVSNLALPGVSSQSFQIRFVAYGASSFNLYRWCIDNILIEGVNCPASLTSLSVSGTPSICAGNSATLSATGGGSSYTWSPSGGNASLAVVSPSTTTSFGLISSIPGCTASPVSAVITVSVYSNPTTLTAVSSSSSVCSGSSVTLTASGANTYTWNTSTASPTLVHTPTLSTTYSVTSTNTMGCFNTQTVGVIVNYTPNLTVFSSTPSLCYGSQANLIASGASTYSWSTGSTAAVISVSPGISTVYTVVGTSTAGCSTATVVSIFVSPTVTAVSTASALCAGSSATLTASGVNTYTWSTSSNSTSIVVTPSVTTAYSVAATNSAGCISTRTITVGVDPNPTVTAVPASTGVCIGSAVVLTATGAATYSWSSGALTASTNVSPVVNTVYTVSGKSGAGCSGPLSKTTLTIAVNPLPTVIAMSSPPAVCMGGSVSLSASGAATYSWSTSSTASSLAASPPVSTMYTVTGISAQLCASVATVQVIVKPNPTVTVVSSASAICQGGTVTLLAGGADSYVWSDSSGQPVLYASPATSTNYVVTGTSTDNCTASQTVSITVKLNPTVTVVSTHTLICVGEMATLTASGAGAYTWDNASAGPTLATAPQGNTTYTVTGLDQNGCSSRTAFEIKTDACLGFTGDAAIDKAHYAAYPNPGTGMFTIRGDLDSENPWLDVYSSGGQLVISRRLQPQEASIDLTDAGKGLYYFIIKTPDNRRCIKVIVE